MRFIVWARELLVLGLFLFLGLSFGVARGDVPVGCYQYPKPDTATCLALVTQYPATNYGASCQNVTNTGCVSYCGTGFNWARSTLGTADKRILCQALSCPPDKPADPVTGECKAPACEPFPATAPIEGQVWDTTDCRWEFTSCDSEDIPLQSSPETGWYEENARWCKHACVFHPITQPSGPQLWQSTGGGCPVDDEGTYDPPLPECEEGEWRDPTTGVCHPPCADQMTRDDWGVCQWDACPEGQIRNESGNCVADTTPDCPVGEHWSAGLGRCVSDDPECPVGTVRQPGGNCLAPPAPVDPTDSDSNTTVTVNQDGSTTYVTTTVTTGTGGSSTTVTTTTVHPDGRRISSVRTTGSGPLPPVQPVEFEPGDGVDARTWAEIHSDFLQRLDDLPPLGAARALSDVFPTGGTCPFGSLDLPWGSVSMAFVCDVWEEVGQVISAAMPAVWVIVGVLILLSA